MISPQEFEEYVRACAPGGELVDWDPSDIVLAMLQPSRRILVVMWDRRSAKDCIMQCVERTGALSDRPVAVQYGSDFVAVLESEAIFTTLSSNPERFRGTRWDAVAFEWRSKMGGNYESFSWRTTTPEQERFRRKNEEAEIRAMRDSENEKIFRLRMRELERRAAEEREQARRRSVSRSSNVGMKMPNESIVEFLRMRQKVEEQARQQALEELQRQELQMRVSASVMIPRVRSAEDRLGVIRGILLRHLREQLQVAPSPDSIYAGNIRARDIAAVVNALEEGLPQSRQWGQSNGVDLPEGEGFSAQAEDGSRVVLTGDRQLELGVIYDPANKPVRKFRLKEEAAA